ncbi:type IV pilus biogenesis protein PilP [Aquitalea magnusonii]|jgi:type IV pilus assembly protein PilP|uniref:Type IV pilus biogenesis protein PilP n=1 Tax=Aquitalea magnusonii TaxID=332411 RepID=A0A3G9GGX2_9NEIS|nr:pilus assembly protein PilP [Aquitalea magnusonii]BBF87118.1 type IV pilus biogenesis protein PilP [Aquitalea magnusonii]
MLKKTLATLLCPLLLTACGSSNTEDLHAWMQQASQGLRGQIDPLPQAQAYQPFTYNAFDIPDPFNPVKLQMAKKQNAANAPDFKRPRELLENYDLDKLKMVGLLKRNNITYALIRTPESSIYRVQPGNFIGPNFGQIKRISDTELVLSETVEDLNGEWVQRETSMYLDEQGQK